MSRFEIIKYPAPILRRKAALVSKVTPEIPYFIEEMAELMYASNGCGLAAPQIGVSLRVIVWDAGEQLEALINPQITSRDGEQIAEDGCLSFPGLFGQSVRAESIVVRGLTPRGKAVTLSGSGRWATIVQHETDHLDGKLFIDRVNPDSLHWVTRNGNNGYKERPTTLEEALAVFEREASR